MLCWRNPSGRPRSPSAASETLAQTPAGSPPAAAPTEPAPLEIETLKPGASCWHAAAPGSETPSEPRGPAPGGRTLQQGEGQRRSSYWDGELKKRGRESRREEA